jgi:predicted helicase
MVSSIRNRQEILDSDSYRARVERLNLQLKFPILEKDEQDSSCWYLRPGENIEEAIDTRPIAIKFLSDLDDCTEADIQRLLTGERRDVVEGHYFNRVGEHKPAMYLLYPQSQESGRVALVLPTEGKLKQGQIQTFELGHSDLATRLERLKNVPISQNILCSVPVVKWVFDDPIQTAKELAQKLAKSAREIESIVPILYKKEQQSKQEGYLHQLLNSFQQELLQDLKIETDNKEESSLADIYAQTVAYTLFTARVFSYIKDKDKYKETRFDRVSAWKDLPETNPFLRKLFQDISERSPEELGDELINAIVDILAMLQAAEMEMILKDFERQTNRDSIVIKFYEDFLKEYNQDMRETRGIYYSPKDCVSYIVRSVDYILKQDFNLADGLADASQINVDGETSKHKVLITDIATGTGTFLAETIDHIYRNFDHQAGDWSKYVSKHLLPRLSGFELLMAPYAIAHLQLGLKLAESGYKFNTNDRLQVCLTNTLSESFQIPVQSEFASWIRSESDTAKKFKQEAPVMVLMGNPPYSGHSANNGNWIKGLLKGKDSITNQPTGNYFEVDGKPLGERNPKWLNDDYVKFIRFGQWRIEQTGYGILAFITNHGYLDNPTFRGMRQSLMSTFDDLYILDLHGNIKKNKGKCPDGSEDENIFDIQQGVSVCFFIKRLNGEQNKTNVYHADLYGKRDLKYDWLEKHDLSSTQWKKVEPQSPFYLFIPQNNDLLPEYDQYWKITDICPVNTMGFQTHRDHFAIELDKDKLLTRMQEMFDQDTSDRDYSDKYLLKDSSDWNLSKARKQLRTDKEWKSKIIDCSYRPFDNRSCYFSNVSMDRPRRELINHVADKDNLCLGLGRQGIAVNNPEWALVSISSCPADANLFRRGGVNIFPLYIYPTTPVEIEMGVTRRSNISPEFLTKLEKNIGYMPTPEAIFHYIYAIFHSPTYRSRYAEFLKIDFPRIPLIRNVDLFRQLGELGEQLVNLHLMKSPILNKTSSPFINNGGGCIVEHRPKYENGRVVINKQKDGFMDVPEAVWNFHVGGYQVCDQWLKDRKGRTLSQADIEHYQKIVVALGQSIELMQQIDEAIPSWPMDSEYN